jgi:tetratricopeptide (TPR) repeat protein
MDEVTSGNYRRYAAIFMPVAAVGGFVADVIQPLAPLSTYVFWVSLVGTAALILGVALLRALRPRLLPLLILTASFFTFSSIILIFQSQETEAKGVLASHFPAIAELQETLGLIRQDVAEIKETTRRTEQAVARVEETSRKTEQSTESIAKSTESIARSLETIREGYAHLNKTGGIIDIADRPEEMYHNARLYEQRGDYANARRSYNGIFAFRLDLLDPHLRYQSFLKIQEGRGGAREIYNALYSQDKRPIVDFARILLHDAPQRTEMLKSFLAANPDFAPGYYELSLDHSAERKGTQSLGDKQAELAALEKFKALHEEGKFLRYFLDQTLAAEWLDDADKTLKALAVVKQALSAVPVTLQAMRSNTDWTVILQFPEVPREIFYQIGGEGPYLPAGMTEVANPATGLKMPKTHLSLKPNTSRTAINIKYVDVGGETRGPYRLEFDPEKELIGTQKQTLSMTKNRWVSFRDYDGRRLLYFTHLVSTRCAIAKVDYGLDTQMTPNEFPLTPCDPKDPYNVGDGTLYIEVPGNTEFASVRLTYKDGTQSETIRIDK